MRLIGDPDQHGAVAAGGMFRHLCASGGDATPELATTHRVRDPADREAARLLRKGRTAGALAALAAVGHLHVADNDIELYLGMLGRWWSSHQAGLPHPMVDRRHATRNVLNRLARQMRRANGELGDEEIAATGERRFSVGDRVVARMVCRDLHVEDQSDAYVRNGASGTVVAVHAASQRSGDRVSVHFDDVGVIELPRSFFDEHDNGYGRTDVGIDHAYAVTSHGVQGAEFEDSTSRIDEGATRAEAYVDITRGRGANHLFLTRAVDDLDGEHLPKTPPSRLEESVAGRLRRSGPERAAIEFSPVERPAPGACPPPAWDTTLPEPQAGPVYLRRRWQGARTRMADYRGSWHPGPTDGAWGWALGAPVPSGPAQEERGALVGQLDAYAEAAATESAYGPAQAGESDHDRIVFAMRQGVPATQGGIGSRAAGSPPENGAGKPGRLAAPADLDHVPDVPLPVPDPRARQMRPRRR